ncbi:MAG: peptidoglycan bridge formation glycyltransferase FemA/FemB family protein [Prevotellaceae bacterium]|jgi:lipid II:glycine glycyltransferase (peptidoglycan interpeptide bridge formation enzyme)|nr:peptidoglycan bridge formation glycyltransferase FemA/FemB family protein [Prevotellaceae bacterium]
MKFLSSASEIDAMQWRLLVQESRTATFFQTRECYDFYAALPFFEPFAFGIEQNNDLQAVAVGYIEKNGFGFFKNFTKRAIIQGGILLKNDAKNDVIGIFLDEIIKKINKETIFLEIRNLNDYSQWKPAFEKAKFLYQKHYNIFIETTDVQKVMCNLSQSKRRQIKIARQNGSEISQITNIEEITELYYCLKKLYNSKIKTPLFPVEFFVTLSQKDFGEIFAIKCDGKIIGGIVVVNFIDKAVYEWFVCGCDREFHRNYPSVLATWAGIDFALQNGIPKFDFMGAGVPEKPYGVREFKSKFGGKQVEYGRFYYVFNPFKYKLGKVGVKFLKLLSK